MGNIKADAEQRELPMLGDAAFGPDFVGMLQGGRLFNIVNRQDIRSIVAKHGLQVKHPVALLVAATLLFLVAVVGLLMAVRGLAGGGAIVAPAAFAVGLTVPGAVCMRNAFVRGYYLDVATDSGCTRLSLAQTIRSSADLAAVIVLAERSGYLVTIDASVRGRD